MQGRRALGTAIDRATRCGYLWAVGCAHLFQGWDILRDTQPGDDPKGKGQQALTYLRQAFAAFQADADQCLSLAVLGTAAPALGLLGNASDAIRMQAGARRYAEAFGMSPGFFPRIGALIGDLPRLPSADPALCPPAPIDSPQLNWTAMVDLLHTPIAS